MQNINFFKITISSIAVFLIVGFLTHTNKEIFAMADTSVYFEWCTNQERTEFSDSQKTLTKVKAYATEQADVVELYGVTRENIDDFMDNGLLVFEMKSVTTNMSTQFFRDITLPHLSLVLLTSVNSSPKMFFEISSEDKWFFAETEECVRVYIAKETFNLEKSDNTLLLPISEKADFSQLKLQDNYHEKKFVLTLPGNYEEFYEQNPVINPYSYVKDITVAYDETNQQTVITLTTENICACKYTLEDGFLRMTIAKPEEIYDKIIVLDAGHGGKDPGALQGKIYEKNINFEIVCTHLSKCFENSDIKVYYTRETDTYIELSERADLAAKVGADLFISLHMNTFTSSSAKGTQVYYSTANNQKLSSGFSSSVLAKKLVNKISTAIETKNRGCTDANYYVVKHNSVPAVLIELGFMTNKSDLTKLTDSEYQKKAAQAIYEAVNEIYAEYFTK